MLTHKSIFMLLAVSGIFLTLEVGIRAAETPSVILANGDQAVSVIVIPDAADRRSIEHATASLIASVVERMAGVALPILRETELGPARVEGGRIVLEAGNTPDGVPPSSSFVLVGETRLAEELGVTSEGLGIGGMRLATSGNCVVLLGGPAGSGQHTDPGGVRYAAIELLERLGCRYLWPGELGLVVPQKKQVAVPPLDVAYTPQVGRRGIRSSSFSLQEKDAARLLESLDVSPDQWQQIWQQAIGDPVPVSWQEWQRQGGQMPNFGHAGAGLSDAERALREHPEWFALQADGTRNQGGIARWRLCKSNPELIAHVAEDIIRRRNEDPSLALVSLCPNDGGYSSWCLCDACRALDPANGPPVTLLRFERAGSSRREEMQYVSLTDRMLFYWNSIAERVTAEHPDLLFGVSAYSRFSDPPVERRLHPNLVVRYVRSDHEGWKGWQEAGAKRIFWRPNILLINRRHAKLQSIVGEMADHMNYFADHGMTMTDISSITHHWATLGLTYYATARLNWNPHLTGDEIIADYARHGFGPGAEFIERYFHRVEQLTAAGRQSTDEDEGEHREANGGAEVMAELRGLLNAAERAAGEDRTIVQRVAFLRLGLNFTELQDTLDDMAERAAAGEAVDRERATLLIDLNGLVLRDLLRRHPLAIHVPSLVQQSATFARWTSLRGRRVSLSDETLRNRINDSRYGLTGKEQSIDDMLRAFGLAGR
ncbi:MAG: DUF4838 domain-containing protein [Pirellulaceae bacterium]|nr:DUF4838 domain-containing protein [Pirellulaceae bacterium]